MNSGTSIQKLRSKNSLGIAKAVVGTLSGGFMTYLIEPRSSEEATRRKEFIFNVVMVSSLFLTAVASLLMAVNKITEGAHYTGSSPLVVVVPMAVLVGLFVWSRRHFTTIISYLFVTIFLLLATYALWQYGYILPEGLLAYAMVIVMAGILISVRAAWMMMALIAAALIGISYVQVHKITHPDISGYTDPLQAGSIVIYLILFLVILMVSWLYNRDIESSLRRAHTSEAALKRERNSLEIKVRKRTKQLQQAQVEKMLELQRFAEFGRLSSTLLHELANPLTSVSLELEQLEAKGYADAVRRARTSVAHMENYVVAARRQLVSQSEEKVFDCVDEIERVIDFVTPRARSAQISIVTKLQRPVMLFGDSVRFDQIIANLLANAIDAIVAVNDGRKKITVDVARSKKHVTIRVKDGGVGIPADEITKIFEPFYTTKQSERGTGIGLYITKQAVEEGFNGKISVTSGLQRGTTFSVVLPLHED